MPASLYFFVMPNEWSWVISRSESVPAKARKQHVGIRLVDGAEPGAEVLGVERRAGDADHLAAELLERGLELAPVGLAHRVVGVEDVDLLAHLVDDVLGEPGGLHPRVRLVREVVLVELRGPHELGARDRVPVDGLVLLGDVHHRQRRAAGDGADQQLHVVLQDELLGLADGRRGLGLVVLGDDLDLVAEDAALGVQLLDRHLHAPRLVLAVALEDADLGAEVADLDDLRLRDGRRRRSRPVRRRRRSAVNPHVTRFMSSSLLTLTTLRSGSTGPGRFAGSAGGPPPDRPVVAPPAAGASRSVSASSNASRTATDDLSVAHRDGEVHEVVVAPDRLEELASGGGAAFGAWRRARASWRSASSGQVAGERREEDHEPPLHLGSVARPERGARAVLEAGGQGRGVSAHLGAQRAESRTSWSATSNLPGLHRELDLLEVRGDRVVPRHVRADVMRGGGTGDCSECHEDHRSECREHGYQPRVA